MSRKTALIKGLALAGLLASSAGSHGAGVLISNPSFELPACPAGCEGLSYTFSVSGWTVDGRAGIFAPGQYAGTAAYLPTDGNQVAWAERGIISQELGVSLTPNTFYTLSVDIGRRADMPFTGYSLELLAGNVVIVSGSSGIPLPAENTFATATLTYTALQSDTHVGEALGIRLISMGPQTSFDNVRLDAIPIAPNQITETPVPAALPLLASALAGLGIMRRRRAKR